MSEFDPDSMYPGQIEALVFASPRGMSENEISRACEISVDDVSGILADLAERTSGRAVRLSKGIDGWAFGLAAEAPVPAPYHRETSRKRVLSEAELATLVVIAQREPATVPEIEAVRKVSLSRSVVDGLANRGLIRPAFKRTDSGRAVAYETTESFLETFGLQAVSDMPSPEEAMALELDV